MSNSPLGHWPTGENAGYDDEYTAPGHTEPLTFISGDWRDYEKAALDSALRPMPLALVPSVGVFGGGGGICEHSFELQSMRVTIENLRATIDNLEAELRSAREMLELAEERD